MSNFEAGVPPYGIPTRHTASSPPRQQPVTDGEEEETPGEPDRIVSHRHVKANVRRYFSIHLLVRFPWWSGGRSGVWPAKGMPQWGNRRVRSFQRNLLRIDSGQPPEGRRRSGEQEAAPGSRARRSCDGSTAGLATGVTTVVGWFGLPGDSFLAGNGGGYGMRNAACEGRSRCCDGHGPRERALPVSWRKR